MHIYEKFQDQCFSQIKTLDFPNCGLKQVDLSPVKNFDNLFRYMYIYVTLGINLDIYSLLL